MAADLHVHTQYSDSTLSVEQIVEEALSLPLSFLAITDHDTVAAMKEVSSQDYSPLYIIAGVELSCEFEGREVHILGYGIDCKNRNFLSLLKKFQEHRRRRALKIRERLHTLGIEIEEVEAKECVSRLHIAEALVKEGYVSSIKEAFERYLDYGRPAYVEKSRLSPYKAVSMLKEMGAAPVLAHPYNAYCDHIIGELKDCGLVGIEVYYPEHKKEDVCHYKRIAERYALVPTGGSDSHGQRKWTKIGQITIEDKIVHKLLS